VRKALTGLGKYGEKETLLFSFSQYCYGLETLTCTNGDKEM